MLVTSYLCTTNASPAAASNAAERRYLNLDYNRLDNSGSLPSLPSLRWLSIQGNGLTSLAGFPLSGSLTWLSLASNKLTTPEGKLVFAPASHCDTWCAPVMCSLLQVFTAAMARST